MMIRSFLLLLVLPWPVWAADLHDTVALEAFVDGVVESSMARENVAGSVIIITSGEQTLLAKGYGYADLDLRIPVTADKTLFRIGSVSKLFTWLSLMQLYESHKLDFDTDINEYLTRIEIPSFEGKPITLKDLMTHTPGFEDRVLGLFAHDASSMIPLAELLAEELPERVRPAGQYASYSNHGVGIAGLIVEEVSGQPWENYIEDKILTPLGMRSTSVRQPLPKELAAQMSRGYSYESGKYQVQGFEFVPLSPAGGVSATAEDMGTFMRMLLNLGETEGVRVLGEDASRRMQSSLFRPRPGFNGMMHGLYETSSHGQLIIGHGGDTLWFHSELMLLPEADLGIFLSTNTANGPAVRGTLRKALLDRFFPAPDVKPAEFRKTDPESLAGAYGSLRRSYHDLTKLVELMAPMTVAMAEHDQLMLSGTLAGGEPIYLEEVAPLEFKQVDGDLRIAFEMGDDGQATHLFIDQFPVVAFERMRGFQSPTFQFFLLIFAFLVFVGILLCWGVQFVKGRIYYPPEVSRFRTIGWWLALTVLIYFIGATITISDSNAVVFGLSGATKVVLSVSYLIFTLTLLLLIRIPALMGSEALDWRRRLGYLMVPLAALCLSTFIYNWRMFAW